jgi:hypothetical protein
LGALELKSPRLKYAALNNNGKEVIQNVSNDFICQEDEQAQGKIPGCSRAERF